MKKISITLSLLFMLGQVVLPSIPVSATTIDSNNSNVIENVDKTEETNNKEELDKDDSEPKADEIQKNEENNSDVVSDDKLGESGLNNENKTEESQDEGSKEPVNKNPSIESNNSSEDKDTLIQTEVKPEEEIDETINDKEEESTREDKSNVEFGEVYKTVKKPRQDTPRAMAESASVEFDEYYYSKEEYAEDMNSLEDIEYLVTKTDSNFEVVLSMGDGVYQYVDSADTIEEAVDKANSSSLKAKSAESAIPAVIDSNGVVVYATNAMGRILKHISGNPYYGSDRITYLYKDSGMTVQSTYINQGYVDDVPVISDIGKAAQIQVSGYTGWINKNTSSKEYDMIIVPLNNVKNPSYYENVNGELYHWISTDITKEEKGLKRRIGVAPSFMKSGVKYYSYDGNYFYTNLNTLISDLKVGNKNNAANASSPYYSYFQFLPFRSKTVYTASDLNRFIASQTESYSKLRDSGQAFINAQNKYGVNAAIMLGIAINESAWGESNLALTKNNLFGLEAYDSNPDDAKGFKSVEQCIDEFANYWISKGYGDPQDMRFYGGFLGGKNLGANVKYASDPFWGEKAASYAYVNDNYLSGGKVSALNDYNSNIIGIFTSPTNVLNSSGQVLYPVSSTLDLNSTFVGTPVVLKSTTKYNIGGRESYAVNPDRTTVLPSSGGSEFIGTYDWNINGYIGTSSVRIINASPITGISYKTHVRDIGWQGLVSNGETAGTVGKNLGVEAIVINLENMPSGSSIKYRAHVESIGWQDWVSGGEIAGTTGKVKNIEAIQIEASGLPSGTMLQYRVHSQDIGWQEWKTSGEVAGVTGQKKKIEAIEIRLTKSDNINISYNSHVQKNGWMSTVSNGKTSGTTGETKRLEAVKINVSSDILGVGVKYRTHVQDIGWQNWVSNGAVAGTTNQGKQVEAIQIMLTGVPSGYHVEYRAHVQGIGWQGWVRDGQIAGTTGKNKRVEAIEVRVVKNEPIDVLYSTHVQKNGWMAEVSNEQISGTTGETKRMEALKIKVSSKIPGLGIKYRVHGQSYGWQDWVKDGQVAGTTGLGKRVEAIEIQLTGAPAGYHVEYRAHVQGIGWQDWVRDGKTAGTTGLGKRIEAIQIRIVKD